MGSYSSSSTSSDSLNGLKFGQKIYFEDVVGTVGINPTKSGGGGGGTSLSAGDAPPASPAKKGRFGGGGVSHGGQPPRCQVEGCNVDLSDAKGYYARHKVCIMHSKSGKVIVSGNEQRFCQQCSRFHQLSEFDQEKRSCRRRLAGHNERRRKPPSGSLLSTRYGSLSSSVYENNSGAGSFLMDFTSYPKPTWRDQWTSSRASEQVSGNQQPEFGRFLPWQSNSSEIPQPEIQASATSNPYNISSGGCFTGVSDSSCALSLLSNQPCNSKGQSSSLGANYELDTHMVQTTGVHAATIGHFPSSSWDYKSNESGTSSVNMHSDLGLGQITQPGNRGYAGDLQLNQQRGRPFMNHEHSKAYYSTHDMHWSI